MTATTRQSYEMEIEVAVKIAGAWYVAEVHVDVPFDFTPNDDRLNPELAGEHEIVPDIYGARIDKVDGLEVRHLPRAVPDMLTQTLIRAALASDFHNGMMLDQAREV